MNHLSLIIAPENVLFVSSARKASSVVIPSNVVIHVRSGGTPQRQRRIVRTYWCGSINVGQTDSISIPNRIIGQRSRTWRRQAIWTFAKLSHRARCIANHVQTYTLRVETPLSKFACWSVNFFRPQNFARYQFVALFVASRVLAIPIARSIVSLPAICLAPRRENQTAVEEGTSVAVNPAYNHHLVVRVHSSTGSVARGVEEVRELVETYIRGRHEIFPGIGAKALELVPVIGNSSENVLECASIDRYTVPLSWHEIF